MKNYAVRVPATMTDGHQVFAVEAENEEDAVKRLQADPGEYEVVAQEIEVIELDWGSAECDSEVEAELP